jgi:hypothetical protein
MKKYEKLVEKIKSLTLEELSKLSSDIEKIYESKLAANFPSWIEEREDVSINVITERDTVDLWIDTWNGCTSKEIKALRAIINITFKVSGKEFKLTGKISPGEIDECHCHSIATIRLKCDELNLSVWGYSDSEEDYLEENGFNISELQPLVDSGVSQELIDEIFGHKLMTPSYYEVESDD